MKPDITDKKELAEIGFIRAICAVGIILFHFSTHSNSEFKILYTFKNGDWGSVIVTIFFAISGMLLYYNHSNIPSLKSFYYKRWKSIFPSFYILFAYYYLENVFFEKQIFYRGRPWTLLLSALGMDGYFSYRGVNYYMIGEWFLGAIIFLYLLYPLLLWCLKKNTIITAAVVIVLFIWQKNSSFFKISPYCNLIYCILGFLAGMIMAQHLSVIKSSRIILAVSLLIFILSVSVKMPLNSYFLIHIISFSLLIILYRAGSVIMKYKMLYNAVHFTAGISYQIFLLQHIVIIKVLGFCNPLTPWKIIITVMLTTVLIMVYACALKSVTSAVLRSKLYTKIEHKLVGKEIAAGESGRR